LRNNRRYYRIAEITIQVDSDLPITDQTFSSTLDLFRVDEPGRDTVKIHHHFELPEITGQNLGKEVYRKPPWAIYQQGSTWLYLGISTQATDPTLHRVVMFNHDHTQAHIYNSNPGAYLEGNYHSLTLFPSDQILIARLLAERSGCYLHSAGAILNGAGMLFVGHSETGKSTITKLLMDTSPDATDQPHLEFEILCDDRNIVRRWDDDWRVYGTWSHGDVPNVSPSSASLKSICFIEKANENKLIPLTDRKEIRRRLLACVIKPFVTADWWKQTLDLIENMATKVPCYQMRFDKSGEVVETLNRLSFFKN
jgi:hypothetical protein